MTKVKILIVDDYAENILALSELIAREDIEIMSAMNANDALELIAKNDFGLALLDVQMPEVNGFDLAKIIRSVERFKSLPIIFVTAQQQDVAFIFEGYKTGAVDLLFKPLDPNIVRTKVSLFVELAQQKAKLQESLIEIQKAKEEADAANTAKSSFLANMSHEIRTPLGAVMGFSELCEDNNLSADQLKHYIKIIRRNSSQVLKLIDEILDLAKVEAGKATVEKVEFSFLDLMRDLTETLSLKAREKGLEFSVQIPSPFPEKIISDPTRIRQVLINAVGNAIKFTEQGHVKLEISIEKNTLKALISDTGEGITNEQASKLFQAFNQADVSTTRRFGGTGLGLALNKKLCQLLGGDYILVKSALGKGSVFQASFQIEITESSGVDKNIDSLPSLKNSSYLQNNLKGLQVLVVDDSPDNLQLMEIFLEREGAAYTGAMDGSEGVSKALDSHYDVILMDIQMPKMDGYQALEMLKQKNYEKPVFALTAHAMQEEKLRIKNAGFYGFLSKPINSKLLIEALVKVVELKEAKPDIFANSSESDKKNAPAIK